MTVNTLPKVFRCPTCKGTGEITITVINYSHKPTEPRETQFQSTCLDCAGLGELTEKRIAQLKEERSIWCSCGKEQEAGVTFYDEVQHPKMHKHHWRCNNCGKVTQIG